MFIEELSKLTGLPLEETFNEYKITNIAGRVVCVENYIKLVTYMPDKIEFKTKNNHLIIEGANLKIAQLNPKEAIITGKIYKSYLEHVEVIRDNGK